MGEEATRVQEALAERLRRADAGSEWTWTLEYDVAGTPVDLGGQWTGPPPTRLALCELEWRRADPADNAAKLFRHLSEGVLDEYEAVRVAQVFTAYYDLERGGVASKRSNAAFVGRRIAASFDHVAYRPFTLAISPPKRGEPLPDGWEGAVDATAMALLSFFEA